jgi:hypothetical protein
MIRRIPKRRALVLRGDLAPVITHLPMVWHDWHYRWARLRGRRVARLYPVQAAVPARPVAPASAPQTETVPPWGSGPIPPDRPLAGSGAVNGHSNGSAGGNGTHPWDRP